MKPNELYEHLFGNCEIECKTELRSIASSLNGMECHMNPQTQLLIYSLFIIAGLAALSIIQGDYVNAAKLYKSVLRWAKDYTGNIW